MKKIWIFLLTLCIVPVACKEKKYPDKDYRIKWEGIYDCNRVEKGVDTKAILDVIVVYEEDSILYIKERDVDPYLLVGVKHHVKVKGDGSFSTFTGSYNNNVWGNFIKDSIFLEISNGTPGGGHAAYFKGKKM